MKVITKKEDEQIFKPTTLEVTFEELHEVTDLCLLLGTSHHSSLLYCKLMNIANKHKQASNTKA